MFKHLTQSEQIRMLQNENAALRAAEEKHAADIEYIGMMCNVELEVEENEKQEI